METICIFAAPRTGTNHMCSLWSHFEDHVSLPEVFHARQAFGCNPYIEPLNMAFGTEARSTRDEALTSALRSDPVRALRTIKSAADENGSKSLSFKVFPRHLKPAALAELIEQENSAFVIVKRLLIDSFISGNKAKAVKAWTAADTTDQLVTLSFQDYKRFVEAQDRWYSLIAKAVSSSGKPHRTLLYEADINCEPLQHMQTAQDMMAMMGMSKGFAPTELSSTHTKQDQAFNYHSKVSNWAEFCHEAREEGRIQDVFRLARSENADRF